MVTILIVDDHLLMRRAVRAVLEKEEGLTVIAEASNGQQAEEQAAQTQPDVVLMDSDMPDCTGFEATERVLACSPGSRVIIFTATHHEQNLLYALHKGAIGYITKDIEPDDLIHAIRCAARNDLCIPGVFVAQMITQLRAIWKSPFFYVGTRASYSYRTPRRSPEMLLPEQEEVPQETTTNMPVTRPLTEREAQILDLMRKGRKNREIGHELCIAESTVHKHVQNIFEKLHARNRTEAIYFTHIEEH
jgi:two-component system, NarL family, nitrate/nitrite response regulator NarL